MSCAISDEELFLNKKIFILLLRTLLKKPTSKETLNFITMNIGSKETDNMT